MVQLVQYPSFRYISRDQFLEFHKHHTNWITPIVGPLMLADLALASWLACQHSSSVFYLMNLAGIIAIFLSTFLISVPIHEKLSLSYDREDIERLIATNWYRTVLYSLRLMVWGYFYFWPSISHG